VSSRSLHGTRSQPASSKVGSSNVSSVPDDIDEEDIDQDGEIVRDEESMGGSAIDEEGEEIEEMESQCSEWEDRFPYEENLFSLSRDFQIEQRIATAEDAIVYRATDRRTGELVAIKFRDEWSRKGKHPKELRLLSAVQGHPVMCELVCWHNLPNTKCHAIVTKLYPNTDIEQYLFGQIQKIRRYIHDLLEVIKYLHKRNVLYRDVKPSNVLWDEDAGRAILIDFDVATFYNPNRLHRRCVGTDGYMAPEVLLVSSAFEELEKQERYQNRQNRDELLTKLPMKGYGLEVDIYSSGVLFGQCLFCYPEEDITDDDNTECSGEGMSLRATKRLSKLAKLRPYDDDNDDDPNLPRSMTLDEYREQLAMDLLVKMLKQNPKERISLKDALNHPFFSNTDIFDALPPQVVPWERAT
jgi:serine/threonine protein kinase